MINPVEHPVQAYLAIQSKIEQNPEEDYPLQEMARDLGHILLACRTLIQHNAELSDMVLEAERLQNDAIVQSFQKDIEIHELKSRLDPERE